MVCAFEQRQSSRTAVSWPVSVWHPQARKFFNGRSINVSNRGALLILPLRAPVRQGQELEVNFPRTEDLAVKKGQFARVKTGTVIRVDRGDCLAGATVRIAMVFSDSVVAGCISEVQ